MSTENKKIKECLHCKLPFQFRRLTAKYCCHSCRQMAWVGRKSNINITVTIQPIVHEKKIGLLQRIIYWIKKK
jgi:hypothetical protein